MTQLALFPTPKAAPQPAQKEVGVVDLWPPEVKGKVVPQPIPEGVLPEIFWRLTYTFAHPVSYTYDLDCAVEAGVPILIELAQKKQFQNQRIGPQNVLWWRDRRKVWIAEELTKLGFVWDGSKWHFDNEFLARNEKVIVKELKSQGFNPPPNLAEIQRRQAAPENWPPRFYGAEEQG